MPHLITLTGASGSGKSTVVKYLLAKADSRFKPKLIPKYTTRSHRKDDSGEVICICEIPDECDIVYEQNEKRYGIRFKDVYEIISSGACPIVILNDVRAVEDVRSALNGLVRSIFIFRTRPTFNRYQQLAKSRRVENEEDVERRFRKAQAIYRIYIENIYLFDHVIINSGSRKDLKVQLRQITKGLKQVMNWPLCEVRK